MNESPDFPVLPYFFHLGVSLDDSPPGVRAAIEEIVMPIYREFVLQATNALERSVGISLTYLLMLEVLHQFELAIQMDFVNGGFLGDPVERQRQIDQYLRIVGSKQKVSQFLLRLRQARQLSQR